MIGGTAVNTARTWRNRHARIIPKRGELEWGKTHWSKSQGEGIILRAKDADLNNPNPVYCWDYDNGSELEEWVILHYHPPTVNFSMTATCDSIRQMTYQALPSLGLQS